MSNTGCEGNRKKLVYKGKNKRTMLAPKMSTNHEKKNNG